MEAQNQYESSQHSVPSPDGSLIATVLGSRLILRSSADGQVYQTFSLSTEDGARYRFLRWSHDGFTEKTQVTEAKKPLRISLATERTVKVFEADNSQWQATINDAASGLGKIVNIDFGVNEDEILIFSDFGVKVTVWSLLTSRGAEIRDPKSIGSHHFRPRTGHFAITTRPDVHDNLLILSPGTRQLSGSIELPTVDAQGLKWSPDGRWLAIWDAASSGYRVIIYTADGHPFRTFEGGQTSENIGLGIKSVAWHPNTAYLAIGDYEDNVTLLNQNTFTPLAILAHTSSTNSSQTIVWEEQIDNVGSRNYALATQPSHPPPSSSFASIKFPKTGISIIEFNVDGAFFATRSDSMPSTVWIWSQYSFAAVACLVHHAPVRSIQWHPIIDDMLLIHCAVEKAIIHVWKASWSSPQVLDIGLGKTGGRMEACWISTAPEEPLRLMVGNANNYTVMSLDRDGNILPPISAGATICSGPDDRFDEGNSMDLSPVKIPQDDTVTNFSADFESSDRWGGAEDLDDTFHYRRPPKSFG